jgi:hypothetical protein
MVTKGRYSENGGVATRVVLAAVTLAIVGVFIAMALQYAGEQQEANHRKAVRISEYGLQAALQKIQETPSWVDGFERTPCGGGCYKVSLRRFVRNDTVMLAITSEGTMGTVSDVKECLLSRPADNPDSAWVPQNIR